MARRDWPLPHHLDWRCRPGTVGRTG